MDLIEKAAQKLKQAASGSLVERAAQKLERNSSPARAAESSGLAENIPAAEVKPLEDEDKSSVARRKRSRYADIDIKSLRDRNFITPDSITTTQTEEFRIVKRSLLLNAFAKGSGEIHNGNLILVTSTQPDEGKTFCAINLAMSMATERDVTVLLVDADFAKPDVLATLGVQPGKGLVDVIEDKSIDLSDCLIRTSIENLVLLPAGRRHNMTTELLASGRMGEIVEELVQRYPDRVIIFDSPPALANSAASVLALHVGQVLFVVESERTREPQLREALSLVSGCRNINLLLNKSPYTGRDKKFGTYYGYGA
jgi:receptor protein-tyrosine kinase